MRTLLVGSVLVLASLAPLPALAASGSASAVKITAADRNYEIKVKVKYHGMEREATFVVSNSAQSNYVEGGDKHVIVEVNGNKGIEYKKWGFIVNILPISLHEDPKKVSIQIQLELSGPVGKGKIKDIATWQFQSEILLTLGKKTVISRKPAYAEITIRDAKVR